MELDNTLSNLKSGDLKTLGLYIHIPFCMKKCGYCDFLSAPATDSVIKEYFEALLKEILSYRDSLQEYRIKTIFFGGGTPSFVAEHYICEVMEGIRQVFWVDEEQLEATIEVNPGTVNKEKLQVYHKAGINRISFGLQSTSNKELQLLGRIHTYEEFEANYKIAREIGFQNINIDLMSSLPGQTLASWENSLSTVIRLNPEHISAYSLIIEEETPFYNLYKEGASKAVDLPDEDTDRLIYHRTKEILEANGYHRYEISNYAKPGKECRHNSSYWTGIEYLGLGLGASSLLNGARFSNMHDIKQYIMMCKAYNLGDNDDLRNMLSPKKPTVFLKNHLGIRTDYQLLTSEQQMEEFMFLGLRMCNGISKNAFFMRFGIPIEEVYGSVLTDLIEKKLLLNEGDNLRLTDYGIDISNTVLSVFLLN